MDPLAAQIIVKALDGLTLRQNVTAENLANAGTPGYRPLRLSFEQALADAAARGPDAVASVVPEIERVPAGAEDSEMRLDAELATASSTALRYAALIDLLNREMQVEALAVRGSN